MTFRYTDQLIRFLMNLRQRHEGVLAAGGDLDARSFSVIEDLCNYDPKREVDGSLSGVGISSD